MRRRPATWASFPPDSPEQQARVEAGRADDGLNWGYDPSHFTKPGGSYATDPEGTSAPGSSA